ncbi:MAG: CBM35 domain-containing protein [bacterium]
MRAIKYVRIFFVTVLFFLSRGSFDTPAQSFNRQIFEAENAVNNGLLLIYDSTASSGKFLSMEKSGSIIWKICTDSSSWYTLMFRYRAFGGEKEELVIRNGYQFAVGFGSSDEWKLFNTQTYLHQGENEIALKESWGYIDIDYLEIEPVEITPTVKPVNNIIYREYPRDLFFKINRLGNKIETLKCGEENLLFELSDFTYSEDAVIVKIPKEQTTKLNNGTNSLKINFDHNYSLEVTVEVVEKGNPAGLTIITPDVEHGASVLFILPTGKTLLVDCGKVWVRDSILIPFLNRQGINKIDYFILTHYHEDHDSGDRGEKIKKIFDVEKFWDYQSFHTGDVFDLDGVSIKVLNCFEDGEEENTRSLSFQMEYNGFVYVHGGDTYAVNQQKIMKRFPDDIEADVFHANHHFHGSVDVNYLRAMDPAIILLQAQQAVYARSAYMQDFKIETEKYLIENKKKYIEDLPAFEVGTTVIRINGKDDWTYETYKNSNITFIPYLFK